MSDLTTQGAQDAAEGLLALYGTGTSRIAIGDSATIFNVAQTDLVGSNKAYKATSSASRSLNRLTFAATFGTSEGNGFTVREIGIDRTTRMLVRNVLASSIAAKTSAEEWLFTIHVDFQPG